MFHKFFHRLTNMSLVLTITLVGVTSALAASGDLDTTFDGDGLVTSYLVPSNPRRWDIVEGVAIQPNGKIVAAGYSFVPSTTTRDFAVTRYNTDGSLDTTFHSDGRLITNFGGEDEAYDVAVQSNGKIVVVGQVCNAPTIVGPCDVALVRYNPSGGLDSSFSGDGKQTTDFAAFNGSFNGSYGGLAIQSNGKIIVAGYTWNGTNRDFAVYRYNADGNLDTTFSGDGRVRIGFGAERPDFATDLVLQSDGKILVTGPSYDANFTHSNFAVARLTAGGVLDTTFSVDGRLLTNFGPYDYAEGVALQPNGKIVLAGYSCDLNQHNCHFALVRYNTNGSLDTTFNGTGKKVFNVIPGADSWARDVMVQSDGKIVVLGYTAHDFAFALVRLKPSGAFDTAFSGDGKVTVGFGGSAAFGKTLALQPTDGRYVLGGSTTDGQDDFALARVLP